MNPPLFLRTLVMLVLALGLFSSVTVSTIVNSTGASPAAIPWQVALRGPGGVVCGGSIIGPNTILTAAHCFDQYQPYQIEVFAATQQTSQFSNPRTIAQAI